MAAGRKLGLGKWGEDQACGFLSRQGFQVIERNYHATVGEIDIIAQKGGDFYFVEVKTRFKGDLSYDTAITADKKRKMMKTISHFCSRRSLSGVGLVPVGLMVVIDRAGHLVNFRLAVLY